MLCLTLAVHGKAVAHRLLTEEKISLPFMQIDSRMRVHFKPPIVCKTRAFAITLPAKSHGQAEFIAEGARWPRKLIVFGNRTLIKEAWAG